AAALAGVNTDVARLAFPGGPMDMIAAWIDSTDARMQAAFADGHLTALKIRDRLRTLLLFRLDAVAGQEEALRRALAIQAMPQNLGRTMKLGGKAPTRCVAWPGTLRPTTTTTPSVRCWPESTPRPWQCSSTTPARARRRPG